MQNNSFGNYTYNPSKLGPYRQSEPSFSMNFNPNANLGLDMQKANMEKLYGSSDFKTQNHSGFTSSNVTRCVGEAFNPHSSLHEYYEFRGMTPCDARKAENDAFAKIATGIGKTVGSIAGYSAESSLTDQGAAYGIASICSKAPMALYKKAICSYVVKYVSHQFIQNARVELQEIASTSVLPLYQKGITDKSCFKKAFIEAVKTRAENDQDPLSRFDDDVLQDLIEDAYSLQLSCMGQHEQYIGDSGCNIL